MRWVRIAMVTVAPTLLIVLGTMPFKEYHPFALRVAFGQMEEGKRLKAPFGEAGKASPEIVAAGKALYQGRARVSIAMG